MAHFVTVCVEVEHALTKQAATALVQELLDDLLVLRQQVPPLSRSAALSGSSVQDQRPSAGQQPDSEGERLGPDSFSHPKRGHRSRGRLYRSLAKVNKLPKMKLVLVQSWRDSS